jgi:UDP-N-acetylglucosamine:LPS N-acetylglucosamine transferase
LVNRIASRYAAQTFTGFDDVLPHAVTVGQMLSDDLVSLSSTPRFFEAEFVQSLPTVFIMGGSQGSRTLYETFAELLRSNLFIASSFTFFITLGKLNDHLKPLFPQKNVRTFDFLTQKEM